MKKIFNLLFVMLLAFGFMKSANAASFNLPVSEDAFYITNDEVGDGFYNANINIVYNYPPIPPYNSQSNRVDTFIKFDITTNSELYNALQNEAPTSIKLNLFQLYSNTNYPYSISAFSVGNNWIEPDYMGYVHSPALALNIANPFGHLITDSSNNDSWVSIDINASKLVEEIGFQDVYSLALTDLNQNFDWLSFATKEDEFGRSPYLTIEVPTSQTAPVPEPSTMILGAMGIFGIALRKRNKKVEV